jgi:hypothetical protein
MARIDGTRGERVRLDAHPNRTGEATMSKHDGYRQINLGYELAKLDLDGTMEGATMAAYTMFDTLDQLRRNIGWPKSKWAFKDITERTDVQGKYAKNINRDSRGGKVNCTVLLTMKDDKVVEIEVSIDAHKTETESPVWVFHFGKVSCSLDSSKKETVLKFFNEAAKAFAGATTPANARTIARTI